MGRVAHAELGRAERQPSGDLEATVRQLKDEIEGEIGVAGPNLAHSLTELGLTDEYRIYRHPVVLGSGPPFFAGSHPPLRLRSCKRMDEDVIRLAYAPAEVWNSGAHRS